MAGRRFQTHSNRQRKSAFRPRRAVGHARLGFVELLESRELLSATPQPRIVNGTPTASFASVGLVGDSSGNFCSGTLIAPQYVLTAGHCAEGVGNTRGRFTVGGATYATTRVIINPGFNGNLIGVNDNANDLAIFQLATSVTNVAPSPLFRDTPRVGQTLTLVGFGAGGTANGHNGDFGTKRVGTTPLEEVTAKRMLWVFDHASESNTAPGDSGGPAFLQVDGTYEVAGVTSGGSRSNAGLGDHSYDTRVDAYAAWIDSIVGNTPPPPPPNPGPVTDDHVNEPGTGATPITLDAYGAGQGSGNFETIGDRDVFQITVTSRVTASIDLRSNDTALDTYLRLYDTNSNLLAFDDDSGFSTDSHLSRSLPAGTYYISAGSYNDGGTGKHTLEFRATVDDFGDSLADAAPIVVASGATATVNGRVNISGDHDFFKFVAPRAGTTVVTLSGTSTGLDTVLAVHNTAGRRIAFNDDFAGTDSRVQFNARAGQTYYIDASGYGSTTGGYRLDVTAATTRARTVVTSHHTRRHDLVAIASRSFLADLLADRYSAVIG